MKILFLFFLPFLFISCAATPAKVTVDGIVIESSRKLGGKSLISVKKGETSVVVAENFENSWREANSTFRFGLGAATVKDVFSTGSATYQSVKNATTNAGVANTAAKEATTRIGLQEATKQQGIALEAAAIVE